ncbi:S24 family peptidase [Sporosarcina psychrophila]|uniref:S24 family peptidase n=1 Tax=Sporosarcina psychrophila TaxID=1476 RepID=UPI003398398F
MACGDPILVEENYEDYRTVLEEHLPAGDLVYLQAKGDSMSPTIPDGSMVLIRIQEEVENGEIAAVTFNLNAYATLKRVKKQNGITILMPDNPAHEPIVVTRDNPVRLIGKAIRSEQKL